MLPPKVVFRHCHLFEKILNAPIAQLGVGGKGETCNTGFATCDAQNERLLAGSKCNLGSNAVHSTARLYKIYESCFNRFTTRP